LAWALSEINQGMSGAFRLVFQTSNDELRLTNTTDPFLFLTSFSSSVWIGLVTALVLDSRFLEEVRDDMDDAEDDKAVTS
jgi:hypothetical protein